MSEIRDLAEDFVLGLLDPSEAAAVEARLRAPEGPEDRALAEAVGAARDAFLALDLTAPEVPLSPNAWTRLAAVLAPRQVPVARVPGRSAPRARRTGRWQLAAFTAMAASVLLGVALAWRILVVETPAVVAVLLDDNGAAVAVLEAFADDSIGITPIDPTEPGPAQVFQIWTKPDPDGPPVSLGVLDTLRRMNLDGPDLPRPQPDQLYEITIEPQGGSPTGLPTGPILGKGLARPL